MTDDPGSFADFLTDIIEAKGEHWADGGLTATLVSDGYTEAGRRRLAEHFREVAARSRMTGG